jgi:amino acid adenylation domain-containing protein
MRLEQTVNRSNESEPASDMSKAKRDLLQKYLQGESGSESITTRDERTSGPRHGGLPLSFAQTRLWFVHQLAPDSPAYNIPLAIELSGMLDVEALRRSLSEIVRRHEVLRTRFVAVDGTPVQLITDCFAVTMPLVDLSDLTEPLRKQEADRLVESEAATPFDLSELPLLRIKLLRLGEQQHILLLNIHHIISDSWSMGVLFSEIAQLYEAFSSGECSPLPDLEIQYADYALWESQWLKAEALERQLSYWRERLTVAPPMLQLPLDRPRPEGQSFRGSQEELWLSQNLSNRLRQLNQREGVTLYMTMLAGFQVLLSKYSGQKDILVGSPIANRNQSNIGGLIGCFLNTLVMRTDLSGNPNFAELLQRVREVALGAFENQDVPFEKIVSDLRPERSLSHHSPIVQVMFVLENAPSRPLKLPGLTLQSRYLNTGASKFDLTLFAMEVEGRLQLKFDYNTDLFNSQTIKRMLDHFETLLEGIASNSNQRLTDLPMLGAAEREQIIVEWNETKTDYPGSKCIHQLFEAQVERAPGATALVFEEQRMSYEELNRRANQLAHYLRKHRVGPEVLVGICVERSFEMAVAVLGTLKAGGAYLPLDPSYPRERLALMLKDAGAPVLLTQETLRERLPADSRTVICLDTDWGAIATESEANLDNQSTADNLAYVIYTSGSAGTPKGVSVLHRGVVRLVKETNYASFGPDEVFLQFAPISFDASTFEVWGSLLNGAQLAVMSPGLRSLEELGAALKQSEVTTLWLTAELFHQMVETQLENLRGVRQLLAGGDVLSVPAVEKVARELTDCQLINGYGPTENTTFTCCYDIKPRERFSVSVPIGKPISNTQVFILDDGMEPVPVGVAGELYIGGDGLARGYLHDVAMTAEKFVPNPFSIEGGGCLYRTGDRALYRANGDIQFLGRIDDQVKVRGYRIELGEIETVLSAHPSIRQNVVIAREDRPGEKRLVAYVVLSEEVETIISDLRRWLKRQLPDYMVPSSFVVLDELPVTVTGKLDRRALPAPDGKQFLENAFVAPRDTLELLLTKTWEKVLEVQPIGVKDNFFDLGGHSLLGVRLFAQIEKVYGKRLPMTTLFQAPTVEQMASLLNEENWSPSWSSLVSIQPGGSKPPLFCLHLAPGHVLFYRDLAQRLGSDQPVYAFQPQGLDGTQPRHTRIEEMAAHYIKEMRALQPEGPYYLGGSSFGGLMAFEMAQQLYAQGQQVGLLALFDTYAPGFLELSSEATALHYKVYRFMQRLNLHLSNLLLLETRGKVAYARQKGAMVKERLKWTIKKRIDSKVKKIANKLSQSSGDSVPGESQQGIDVALQALREYVPKVYPGQVTLFRASKRAAGYSDDRELGWLKLAAGGVKIHEIPGYHGSIVMEPRVRILAEQLQACLSHAQESIFIGDSNLTLGT